MRSFLFSTFGLILSWGLLAAPAAHAQITFEPYAGYEIGDAEQGSSSDDASGLNLGFRVGGEVGSVILGLEYALAELTVEYSGPDEDFSTKDLGLFVGGDLGTVRVWFTYWLDSEGKPDSGSTYEGSGGYKIGVGFNAFSKVNLNIEKTLRVWDKVGDSDLNNEIEIDAIMISASLPFTF